MITKVLVLIKQDLEILIEVSSAKHGPLPLFIKSRYTQQTLS